MTLGKTQRNKQYHGNGDRKEIDKSENYFRRTDHMMENGRAKNPDILQILHLFKDALTIF